MPRLADLLSRAHGTSRKAEFTLRSNETSTSCPSKSGCGQRRTSVSNLDSSATLMATACPCMQRHESPLPMATACPYVQAAHLELRWPHAARDGRDETQVDGVLDLPRGAVVYGENAIGVEGDRVPLHICKGPETCAHGFKALHFLHANRKRTSR